MNGFRVVVFRSFALPTLTLLFSSLLPSPSRADGLTAGDHVRVKYSGGENEGKLLSNDFTSGQYVRIRCADTGAVNASNTVVGIEQPKKHTGRYVIVGALMGGAAGGILVHSLDDNSGDVLGGIFVGAVLGGIAGYIAKPHESTPVPLSAIGLRWSHNTGAEMSLTVPF